MSFDLFGPATKCDIRVGYISTDRGFVDRVGLWEANKYAQANPGTIFIFRTREKVQYLNINEVNKLQPNDMLPSDNAGSETSCPGITALNPEGDSSKNIDESLGYTETIFGSDGRQLERDTTRVNFYGGGGVGVQANPVVGVDGSLMAVDVIHGGFGYQYPPLVAIEDDNAVGSGAVALALLREKGDRGETYVEEYDQEDDFEEYIFDQCVPPLQSVGFGKRWGPNGEDLGEWEPGMYIGTDRDPIAKQIELYQDLLASLTDRGELNQGGQRSGSETGTVSGGARLDPTGKTILEWWTTRKKIPLKVVTPEATSRTKYDVTHRAWGTFMDTFAISPTSPSNIKGTDNAGKQYTFEWEQDFLWDGVYTFRVQADNDARLYFDNKPITDVRIGAGGAAGHVLSSPLKIKKQVNKGSHKITLSLLNHEIKEIKQVTRDIEEVTGESNIVTFKLNSNADYSNGFQIPDLGIDVSKIYKGPQLNEKITKTVEYGRVYSVQFRSAGSGSLVGGSLIKFTALNNANNPIQVTNNRTRLALKDGDGSDINASFTIDKGTVRFSSDGKTLEGKGRATFTLSWNDNPRTAGQAVGSIRIGDKTWTQSGRSGSQTQTVMVGGDDAGSNKGRIQLRNKGEKVIEMEDAGGTDFNDLVASCTSGKFYDLNGSTCKFTVPSPPPKPASTEKGDTLDVVFNTIDWIGKANRQLWKINPGAGKDANFINRYGVLPFDPTPVAKVEKKVKRDVRVDPKGAPPTVKFLKEDGKNYMKVTGTGKVKVFFEMNVNDRPGISSLALSEIKIKTDGDDLVLRRDPNRRYANERGSGEFTAGQKYAVKTIGGSKGSGSIIGVDKTTIGYDDDIDNGYDENGNLRVTAVTPLPTVEQITESVLGYPNHPNASTDDFAGVHEIIWDNVKFPADGNYSVEIMVDDNVVLTFSHPGRENIIIKKDGFKIRGDGSTGTGKSNDVIYFREGSYKLKAELEQIPGKPIAKGNPMALALNIKTAFVLEDVEIISPKSWYENPMGVAMVIEAPMPPIPQEIPKQQKGRCPNNPIWTTRFPDGDQNWYPVRVDFWEKFMNRYAVSPIPPLGSQGTDGSGVSYKNTWKRDLPHSGYYGVKGTVDSTGRILIDGQEVLGPNTQNKINNYESISPSTNKIFLEKGMHEITVEVENDKQYDWNVIDEKIFSTADWASKQNNTQKVIGNEPTIVDVTFKVVSDADYANSIVADGLFEASKRYKGPQINETITKPIEVGKVYNIRCSSVQGREDLRITGERVLGMEDAGDKDYNDLICSATEGKFFNINAGTCQFTVPFKNKVETIYGKGFVSGTVQNGVTYTGPDISTYANSETLGPYLTPTWDTDKQYIATHNGTTWTLTWTDVDFPETGTYDIQAQADDELIVKLDGVEICKAEVTRGKEVHMFNAPKGKRTLEMTLMNLDFQAPFSSNPAVLAVKITKKTNVAKVDPRTGIAKGKPWTVNPIGISAVLIPPPCPKEITGVGIVTDVVIYDPGNGWTPPVLPSDPTPSYPIDLTLEKIIPSDPGINYGPGDQVCITNTITGEKTCFDPVFGPFGEIVDVPVTTDLPDDRGTLPDGRVILPDDNRDIVPDDDGRGISTPLTGFTAWPTIRVEANGPGKVPTGVGAQFVPKFKVVRDPIEIPDPSRLLQVTDLVGLKRTGFYDGKPYYGAVFYKDGIRYAGYYQTAGKLVQIYDTLQESIDATITTPPSAIQRQGTDINSNDPRLNIPGTPDNLI
tara:strand:- start:1424 stop:6634 length:5211 start_codon:yes stop_codon:yes gene_type:complete